MTTVISALLGGMGSARAVTQSAAASAEPSGFSELLAQASGTADGGQSPAADGSSPVQPSPSANEKIEDSSETTDTETGANNPSSDATDADTAADLAASQPEPAVAVAGQVPPAGGNALPEAATEGDAPAEMDDVLSSASGRQAPALAQRQENEAETADTPAAGAASGREQAAGAGRLNMSSSEAVEPDAAPDAGVRKANGESRDGVMAQQTVSQPQTESGPVRELAKGGANGIPLADLEQAGMSAEKLTSAAAEAGEPAVSTQNSSQPVNRTQAGASVAEIDEPPVSIKDAGQPVNRTQAGAGGTEAGQALVSAPNATQPASHTRAEPAADFRPGSAESAETDKAPVALQPDASMGARAQAAMPAASQPVAQTRNATTDAAGVPPDLEVADDVAEDGQAAQPKVDAAAVRQEASRQPATPEWLAQIEHGRRWQQAAVSTTAATQVKGQSDDAPVVTTDTGMLVSDEQDAGTTEQEVQAEESLSRSSSVLEGMTPAAAEGSRVTAAQHTVSADAQASLSAISAARDGAVTGSERMPQPQTDRLFSLHQGEPEQNARQLAQQVQVMVNQDLQEADIRLNPSELGGMRIQLKFEQGEVSLQIQAQNPQARELLDQAMPRLRDMLGQQGIQLGQGQVGSFAGQQGTAQNGASGQGATGRENGHNPSPFEQGAGDDEPASGSFSSRASAGAGRIDFFA